MCDVKSRTGHCLLWLFLYCKKPFPCQSIILKIWKRLGTNNWYCFVWPAKGFFVLLATWIAEFWKKSTTPALYLKDLRKTLIKLGQKLHFIKSWLAATKYYQIFRNVVETCSFANDRTAEIAKFCTRNTVPYQEKEPQYSNFCFQLLSALVCMQWTVDLSLLE